MTCGRCGNVVPGVAKFCNKCGAPMQAAPQPSPPPAAAKPATSKPASPRRRPPKQRSQWPLIAGASVIGVAGVVTAYLIVNRGDDAAKRPPPVVGKADRENLPPQVKGVVAKASRIESGRSTELTATIVDPEQDPFHAWWTASCGAVVAKADAPNRAVFLAPTTPGPCAITLEVQDHQMKRGRRLQYTIVVTGGV